MVTASLQPKKSGSLAILIEPKFSTSSHLSQPGWFINSLIVANQLKNPECA